MSEKLPTGKEIKNIIAIPWIAYCMKEFKKYPERKEELVKVAKEMEAFLNWMDER